MAKARLEPTETRTAAWDLAGDGEPVLFVYRPIRVFERLRIINAARRPGPPTDDISEGVVNAWIDTIVSRVCDWTGVEIDGAPAPCTEENKRQFFSTNLGAYVVMFSALNGTGQDPKRPNASGNGSDSSSPIPESSAEKSTNTESNAQTTDAVAATAAPGSTG